MSGAAPANGSRPRAGTRVLVHGLGRFGGGREAIRYLVRCGCRVRVCDRSDADELRAVQASFGAADIDWQLGREDHALLDDVELMVVSPAIPDGSELLQEARRRGVATTQEVELFLDAYPGRVVGITGTNGKSSTATLLHRALRQAGVDALLGGNIGHSLLSDEAEWRPGQVAVLELSSFQLERFAPGRRLHGAIFTRVLSDHLDRHGDLASYRAAKGRLAEAATDFVVHAGDDPVANGYATDARRRGYFTLEEPGPCSAGVVFDRVLLRTGHDDAQVLLHRAALRLLGAFQLENVLAAALAAGLLGADRHAIGFALATAAPLPFRLQLLTSLRGVRVYDNSVSTEVTSTENALATLRRDGAVARLHWIGGGKSKDGDYARVADAIAPHADTACLFGAAAEPMRAAFAAERRDVPEVHAHATLREALETALRLSRPGDAILFSPAFASFDQYPNFRARALEFHSMLRERRAAEAVHG